MSTMVSVRKPTAAIRDAAAVVRDVCSRDLPERTVTSGGLAQRDAQADTREWQDGPMPHPYVPSDVDVWLRERA